MTKERELLRRMLPLIVWPEKELLALCKEAVAYLNSEEGKEEEQEPVAWGCYDKHGKITFVTLFPDEYENKFVPLFLHPAPSAEKQEEEPVAWRCCMPGQDPILLFDEPSDERYPPGYKDPLYYRSAPSAEKREPITEDEMTESQAWPRGEWEGFVAGVRFAEKHHKIGGGDE